MCAGADGGQPSPFLLNCVNVGLVANIMNIKHKTRRFWGMLTLSHLSSMFLLLFQRMEHKMHFKVNLDDIDKSVMTVCIGSARGYGQTRAEFRTMDYWMFQSCRIRKSARWWKLYGCFFVGAF